MQRIIKYLENQSKPVLIGLGLFLVLVIGFIDYLIPPDISTSIFYLIPVAMTTWFVGKNTGVLISIASAIAWFIGNETSKGYQLTSIIPYWNASVRLGFFLTIAYLLSELKSSLNRERKMARTDEVTGVANKRLFLELATMEVKKSRRYGHPFTVAYIDLDNLKNINEHGGSKIGEQVLKTVAQTIKATIRETDIIARLGGDEFALLLPGLAYEPAHIVISRVQNKLALTMEQKVWPLTFTIGAITFINTPESVDEIIEKADYLMYCIKNNGKNVIQHTIEM